MLYSRVQCDECDFEKIVPSESYSYQTTLKCPRCHEEISYKKNIYFERRQGHRDLDVDDLFHPLDKAALAVLAQIPFVSWATRKMMEHAYEDSWRESNVEGKMKVTSRTCSYIDDMNVEAARILQVRPPAIYVQEHPVASVHTTCVNEPAVIITSGLIELCSDAELYAVIGHEQGHIRCEHVRYRMLVDFLAKWPGALAAGVDQALLEWHRKSQLSADRAAFMVTGDKSSIITMLIKISGGSSRIPDQIDYDNFVSHGAVWEDFTGNWDNEAFGALYSVFRTHPLPMLRAHEISLWAKEQIHPGVLKSAEHHSIDSHNPGLQAV